MFFRQLEYFCAIAQTGSYRLAAEKLFVSQSAISQQVKALEAELGQPLTQRSGRTFTLTPAGQRLAHEGQRIIDDAHRLQREISSFDQTPKTLRVGYLNRYCGCEVHSALAEFCQRRPNVQVSAQPGSHDDLANGILEGQLDILLNDRRRQLSDAWENHPLFRGYDYVEVSAASRLAWRESLTVQDLADETCILMASDAQQETERTYYRDVLSYPCEFVFAANAEQAHLMAAAKQGVLPVETQEAAAVGAEVSSAAANGSNAGSPSAPATECAGTRRIPLVNAAGQQRIHEYYAFWLKSNTNPAIVEFAQILKDLFKTKGHS